MTIPTKFGVVVRQRPRARSLWFCLFAFGLVMPQISDAQILGRVFYTPAQRAELEANERPEPVIGTHAPGGEGRTATPDALTYNGVVRRSKGPTTAWANGQPIKGRSQILGGIRLDLRGSRLVVTENGERTVLAPGEKHVLRGDGPGEPENADSSPDESL